ncbi:MAG: hypothetical protein HZA48_05465 [Planctomycetes bacterium]|nr:hypothetical protein [Planctomycetota bacterium]
MKTIFLLMIFCVNGILFLRADVSMNVSVSSEILGFDGRPESVASESACVISQGRMKFSNKLLCADTVILSEKNAVISVNHNMKTYTEITFQQIADAKKGVLEKLRASLARIAGSNSALEIETRALIGRFAPAENGDAAMPVVKEAAEGAEIAGFPCRRFTIEYRGLAVDAWFADKDKYAGLAGEKETLIKFYEIFELLDKKVLEELRKIEGFPLRIDYHANFRIETFSWEKDVHRIETFSALNTDGLGNEAFAVPEGYAKVESAFQPAAEGVPVMVPPGGTHEGTETEEEFE